MIAPGERGSLDVRGAPGSVHSRPVKDEMPRARETDRFGTVGDGPETELRVRGSRFLGQALAAGSESLARDRREEIRKRHHDATHHCLAMRLAPPESPLERFDDDGEPSGTGGAPLLAALRHARVFDTLVVVTRWFGGTKLGTGGLARAYGDAARLALDAAPRLVIWQLRGLLVSCAWEDIGTLESLLARETENVARVEREFSDAPRLRVLAGRSEADGLGRRIVDATAGRATVELETGERSESTRIVKAARDSRSITRVEKSKDGNA